MFGESPVTNDLILFIQKKTIHYQRQVAATICGKFFAESLISFLSLILRVGRRRIREIANCLIQQKDIVTTRPIVYLL